MKKKIVEENLKKIAKGASIVTLGIVVSKILGYIYRIIIARNNVEGYGLFITAMTIYSFFLMISLFGFSDGIVRFVSEYISENKLKKLKSLIIKNTKFVFITSIIGAIVLFMSSNLIAEKIFHNNELGIIIQILAIALPFNVLHDMSFSILQGFQKVHYEVNLKNIIENILKIIFSLILLKYSSKLGIPLAFSLSVIIVSLIAFYYLKKHIPKIKYSVKGIVDKQLMNFSLPLLVMGVFSYVVIWIDTVMLGYFKDVKEVGLYHSAVPNAQLFYLIPFAIYFIFFPVLTAMYENKNFDEFKRVYKISTRWIFTINVFALFIFLLFSEEILVMFFGYEYIRAAIPLAILSVGYFVGYLLTRNSDAILLIYKKPKVILFYTVIGATINIILNLIFVPKYGIIGAATATSLTLLMTTFIALYKSSECIKENIFFPLRDVTYAKLIGILVVMFLLQEILLRKLLDGKFYWILLNMVILFLIYGVFILITKSYEEEDVNLIKMRLRKFVK